MMPALSVADVGLLWELETDIAIESADLVLTTNNLLGGFVLLTWVEVLIEFRSTSSGPFIYNVAGIPTAAGVFSGIESLKFLNPELAGLHGL